MVMSALSLLHITLCLLLLAGCSLMKCIHDDIDLPLPSASHIEDEIPDIEAFSRPHRFKRDEDSTNVTEALFHPLRIHIHDTTNTSLSKKYHEMLKIAVEKATEKISKIISVIPVTGPLVLPRSTSCSLIVKNPGIDFGKCLRSSKYYLGEFCLHVFKIPDDHLEGFKVYNATDRSQFKTLFKAGPGVVGADIILYVVAVTSKECLIRDGSVLSFASHCVVDKTGRPIAGLINFCPQAFIKSNFTEESIYATALHELLHVLGFSAKLFKNYQTCNERKLCAQDKSDDQYLRFVDGQLRLISPTVVNKTRQHFGCYSKQDFGGPLELKNGRAGSHWDRYKMHTSVMTAIGDNVSQPVLDPITLAVFQDHGWYSVNFSLADPFLWGRDAGCSFAVPGHFQEDYEHFCSNNASGCHFMRRDKGLCDADKTKKRYGIYNSLPQGSCVRSPSDQALLSEGLETFSSSSRCFWSSMTPLTSKMGHTAYVGQCYERTCTENGTIFVKLKGTDWIPCPKGETIEIPGVHGEILCPNSSIIMCYEERSPQETTETWTQQQDSSTSPIKSRSTHRQASTPTNRLLASTEASSGVEKGIFVFSSFLLPFLLTALSIDDSCSCHWLLL